MLDKFVRISRLPKTVLDADKLYRHRERARQIFCNSPAESTGDLMFLNGYNRSSISRGLKNCCIIQRLHARAIYYAYREPLFFQFSRGQNRVMHQWAAPDN